MKRCAKCKCDKPFSCFSKNRAAKDGLQWRCKECVSRFQSSYRIEMKAIINKAKDQPCMDCGVSYPSYVMDFDHRDPSLKKFELGDALSKVYSTQLVLDEIAKCDVVCANCHRTRTYASREVRTWI